MTTKQAKSVLSFVRAQLGFAGTSEHNGHGSYKCYVPGNVSWEKFMARVELKLIRWRQLDLIESADISILEDKVRIVFKSGPFDNTFRIFAATKESIDIQGWYNIYF